MNKIPNVGDLNGELIMDKINYSKVKNIKYYHPNLDLSEEFYTKFKDKIKTKECYDNIYHIVNNYSSLSNDYPNIYIVYGGVQIDFKENPESNLFVKHCFFRLQDKIIDPTMYKNNLRNKQTKYFSVIEYNINEYFNMLVEYEETLPISIMRELNKVTMDLLNHNITYAG